VLVDVKQIAKELYSTLVDNAVAFQDVFYEEITYDATTSNSWASPNLRPNDHYCTWKQWRVKPSA